MPIITIDKNALDILKKVKVIMKRKGIEGDYSDVIRFLYRWAFTEEEVVKAE